MIRKRYQLAALLERSRLPQSCSVLQCVLNPHEGIDTSISCVLAECEYKLVFNCNAGAFWDEISSIP